ncbi:MAG: AmmeMemoRadiSam system protein B [Acidobacteria bacterium]|nr:AmmeMemoRadiSam system protein B [Acidobacteriota bacterium]
MAEVAGGKEVWVRGAALAGTWYPADPEDLRSGLRRYLDRAERDLPAGRPVALVSPHAAHRYSGQAAACGFRAVRGCGFDRVVVLGVSHRVGFYGGSIQAHTHEETPLGRIPIDADARRSLLRNPLFQTVPMAHDTEHSIEIQLPFLQEVLGEFTLVPILFGHLRAEDVPRMAESIAALRDERTLLLASSDFTHYGARFGYLPFRESILPNLRRLDLEAINAALGVDRSGFAGCLERTGITVCGRNPIRVLLEILPPDRTTGTLLSYYTSLELARDYGHSVSYASLLFTEGPCAPAPVEPDAVAREPYAPPRPRFLDSEAQRFLLGAARRAVEARLREGRESQAPPEPPPGLAGLDAVQGSFVTLTRGGRLRGCIGNVEPRDALYDSVLRNAVQAAVLDRRFPPLRTEELGEVEIEVSVLGPAAPVPSASEILLGWQGIVFEKGDRRAVFLPEIAPKYGWSLEEALSRLSEKAGLPADAWREGAQLSVFETQTFVEDDFPGLHPAQVH